MRKKLVRSSVLFIKHLNRRLIIQIEPALELFKDAVPGNSFLYIICDKCLNAGLQSLREPLFPLISQFFPQLHIFHLTCFTALNRGHPLVEAFQPRALGPVCPPGLSPASRHILSSFRHALVIAASPERFLNSPILFIKHLNRRLIIQIKPALELFEDAVLGNPLF